MCISHEHFQGDFQRIYLARTGASAEISNSPYNQPRLSQILIEGSHHVPEVMDVNAENTSTALSVPTELADREGWSELLEIAR